MDPAVSGARQANNGSGPPGSSPSDITGAASAAASCASLISERMQDCSSAENLLNRSSQVVIGVMSKSIPVGPEEGAGGCGVGVEGTAVGEGVWVAVGAAVGSGVGVGCRKVLQEASSATARRSAATTHEIRLRDCPPPSIAFK